MTDDVQIATRIASILDMAELPDASAADRELAAQIEAVLKPARVRQLRAEAYWHWAQYLDGQVELAAFELKWLRPRIH